MKHISSADVSLRRCRKLGPTLLRETQNSNVTPVEQGRRQRTAEAHRHILVGKIDAVITGLQHSPNCKFFVSGLVHGRDIASITPVEAQPIAYGIRDIVLNIDRAIEHAGSSFHSDYERNQFIAGLTEVRHMCAIYAQMQFKLQERGTSRTDWIALNTVVHSFAAAIWSTLQRALRSRVQVKISKH